MFHNIPLPTQVRWTFPKGPSYAHSLPSPAQSQVMEEGKTHVGPSLSKFCMNDAIPHVRTQGSAAGSKQPHRTDKCYFSSKFLKTKPHQSIVTSALELLNLSCPFFVFSPEHSVETVPSESNNFYNIPSEKKIR